MHQVRGDQHLEKLRERCPVDVRKHLVERPPHAEVLGRDQALHGQGFQSLGEDTAQQLEGSRVARLGLRQPIESQTSPAQKSARRLHRVCPFVAGGQQRRPHPADRDGAHDGDVDIVPPARLQGLGRVALDLRRCGGEVEQDLPWRVAGRNGPGNIAGRGAVDAAQHQIARRQVLRHARDQACPQVARQVFGSARWPGIAEQKRRIAELRQSRRETPSDLAKADNPYAHLPPPVHAKKEQYPLCCLAFSHVPLTLRYKFV